MKPEPEEWQLKSVTKTSDGFAIFVGKKDTNDYLGLIAGVILALSLMEILGVVGVGWFFGLLILCLFIVHFLYWPMIAIATIIAVVALS
jgi:hypothetical protein